MPNDEPRNNYTVTAAGGYIYLFGGSNYSKTLNLCLKNDLYYLKNDKWYQLKDCPFYKIHMHSSIYYEHNVYFFGGKTEDTKYNCFYKYDSLFDNWSLIETYEESSETPPPGVNCQLEQVNGIFYLLCNSKNYIYQLDLNLIRFKPYFIMLNSQKVTDINFHYQ